MDNVFYIDTFGNFVQEKNIASLFEDDGCHPNIQGTIKMAMCIREAVQPRRRPQRNLFTREEKSHSSMKNLQFSGTQSGVKTSKPQQSPVSVPPKQIPDVLRAAETQDAASGPPQLREDSRVPSMMPFRSQMWPIYPFYPMNQMFPNVMQPYLHQ